jgi:hypothetical protein
VKSFAKTAKRHQELLASVADFVAQAKIDVNAASIV